MDFRLVDWFKLSDLVHLISNKAFLMARRKNLISDLLKKNSYESLDEYEEKVFPLFQNEHYQSLAKEMNFHQKLFEKFQHYALRLMVTIDEEYEASPRTGIKLLVTKQMDEIENQSFSWKYQNFSQYLSFKKSTEFICAIFIKNQENKNKIDSTLSIFNNQNGQQFFIIPYSDKTILNFIYKKEGKYYFNRKQLILNLIPISSPRVYQKEVQTIFQLKSCNFYELILQPSELQNQSRIDKFTEKIKIAQENYFQNHLYTQHFDDSQLSAIKNATDFSQKFTLIEGPPGTGKTQTIFGILSILQSSLKESRKNNKKDIILILGKSNSVVNDLVRKINQKLDDQNSIINCSDEQPDHLKVVRFGRPELCENDIARYSLEIRSQEQFFEKYKSEINSIFSQYITQEIKQLLIKEEIQDYLAYLIDLKQQITLVSLMKYIEYVNFKTKNQKILNAFGQVYDKMYNQLKAEEQSYQIIEQEFLKYRHIIVSTLNSCCKKRLIRALRNVNLRMCIVDEAPTALEPSQLIPFIEYSEISKIVLLGDTKQLSPIVVANQSEKYFLNRSLFERMLQQIDSKKLKYQYRQMPNLAQITSKIFYSGTLKTSLMSMQFPEYIRKIVRNNRNSLFFNTPYGTEQIQETSYKNSLECKAIIQLVKYLLSDEIKLKKNKIISIISGYSMQKELLRMQLKENELLNYVEVDTFDSFQGKENEIVILSLVRSNDKVGFLTDKRRVNVALSRAKYCQFVFGSQFTLEKDNRIWQKIIKIYKQNKQIIDYDDESFKQESFFKQQLNLIQ
ncbi:unnamed protein product [Paramecium sonneborni]|uniref:Uncharacterized protein n=1 Tax=Paramecium sonneborni TaxID=65129 RepID=A0A8S1NC65_9CILI|nr:unnamed protein product [Paramecium sonneborni]